MSRVADLLTRQGEVAANRETARTRGRAGMVTSLAMMLPNYRQSRMEEDDRREQTALRSQQYETGRLQQENIRGQIDQRGREAMEAEEARLLADRAKQVDGFLTSVASLPDPQVQAETYVRGRQALIDAGVVSGHDFPSVYPGPQFIKGQLARLLPAKERFAAMFPEEKAPTPEELVQVDVDGTPTWTPRSQAAGKPAYRAPAAEPRPEYEWVTRGGQPMQIQKGSAQPGDRPYQPPSQAQPSTPQQEWVIRGGQVVPIPRGSAQPGDQPYDAVAARQGNAAPPEEARYITEQALTQAKRLFDPRTGVSHVGIDAATGAWEMRGDIAQDAINFNSIREQLVNALALPNLGALRGPLSNQDVLFVKNISTRLANRRLSRQETERAIGEAITFLEAKLAGAPAPQMPPIQPGPGRAGGPGPAASPTGPQRIGRFEVVVD